MLAQPPPAVVYFFLFSTFRPAVIPPRRREERPQPMASVATMEVAAQPVAAVPHATRTRTRETSRGNKRDGESTSPKSQPASCRQKSAASRQQVRSANLHRERSRDGNRPPSLRAPHRHGHELLEFENASWPGLQPRTKTPSRPSSRRQLPSIHGRRHRQVHRRLLEVPVARPSIAAFVKHPLGQLSTGAGRSPRRVPQARQIVAPGIADPPPRQARSPSALLTVIKAVDSMIPIAADHRELIIVDRKTGKPRHPPSHDLTRKGMGVIASPLTSCNRAKNRGRRDRDVLKGARRDGVHDGGRRLRRRPVAAPVLAPYAGCTMAEYFMWKGERPVASTIPVKAGRRVRQLSLLSSPPPHRPRPPW